MAEKLKILCITDPATHPPGDTTIELYCRLSSDSRFDLWHAHPADIRPGSTIPVVAISEPLTTEQFFRLGSRPGTNITARSLGLIFSRADKPYPQNYLNYLAELETFVPAVNRSRAMVQAGPRQFMFDRLKAFLPDSLFTRDFAAAVGFVERHQRVVAKKNLSYGGKGVYQIRVFSEQGLVQVSGANALAESFSSIVDAVHWLWRQDSEPFEFVPFRRGIEFGDKRVLVVDREIYGAYLRKSSKGDWIHNFTQGATWAAAELSPQEKEIIERCIPCYRSSGIFTLGFDFLCNDREGRDWRLSEVNAGNIGGYNRLEELSGRPIFKQLLNWLWAFPARYGAGQKAGST